MDHRENGSGREACSGGSAQIAETSEQKAARLKELLLSQLSMQSQSAPERGACDEQENEVAVLPESLQGGGIVIPVPTTTIRVKEEIPEESNRR